MSQEQTTEKKVTDFYDKKYYQSENLHAIRPLEHYKKVFRFLGQVRTGARILDVGCGTGLFLKAAVQGGLHAHGVDISQRAVEISKKNVPEATVLLGKGEALPFDDKFFDYLFYGGTLEHFLDIDKGLSEGCRVAKDEAIFMIIVPNKNYWLWKVRGESGTHQKEIKELLLSRGEWVKIFNKHGLREINVYQDPWPWESVSIFKFKNPWRILRRLIYRVIWLFIPLQLTYQFVFLLKKEKS